MLVDKAVKRWALAKQRADNTSVVTLLLDPPGPPKAQVLIIRFEIHFNSVFYLFFIFTIMSKFSDTG